MQNLFVVSDPHGKKSKLDELLRHWNPDSQQLILLGDYIDRGEDSYGVLHLVQKLHREYGAIPLGGNHEEMFLNFLDNAENQYYLRWREEEEVNYADDTIVFYANGGDKTIDSFFDRNYAYKYLPTNVASLLRGHFADDIEFIRNLPSYYETDKYIFVHAGVNLALMNWKNTEESDFRWIRRPFHYGKNETGKTIVFGHTPTSYLHPRTDDGSKSHNIWVSPCGTKIGIDGGAVFGGYLHGLHITEDGYHVYSA